MNLRLIGSSLIITILLLITAILVPDYLNINENLSKVLFTIPIMAWLAISKEKWWFKLAALLLGGILVVLFIVLFLQ
ncbi:hypothetical protein CEQ21_01860 [Niallia circulans]|uniref:Uncharacterized protein n=1 Tax=Niallia circulans TaxID=1397 RepID=A0A553SRV0_NIACI|nr:hypothetical protein [Niallia circulans]TRZ39714.1 hypothetical protein CEQ21_01860 [Niallia circulans]